MQMTVSPYEYTRCDEQEFISTTVIK